MLRKDLRISLGDYRHIVDAAQRELREHDVVERIYQGDHSVWKPRPDEIANRLGWLTSPRTMMGFLNELQDLADEVTGDGYTRALLLGMGGSSLAPEVLRKTLGVRPGYLDLSILDSTDPAAVQYHTARLDPSKTLFIVSTKSGTTVETISFFTYFYNWVSAVTGQENAGKHFIAITDPHSTLAKMADTCGFRRVYLNDPDIGGRYSALSHFGLVPAVLMGADVRFLLNRALQMRPATDTMGGPVPHDDTGILLGTIMGALAGAGRDKMTLVTSALVEPFGAWIEQLIAESTGKEAKGVIPVIGEALGPPEAYGPDRFFVCLCLEWDRSCGNVKLDALERAGYPVVYLYMKDLYDLGRQFFLWELATAVAAYFLKINPFDQPDVEAAKVRAGLMLDHYRKEGTLPPEDPMLSSEGIKVFGTNARTMDRVLQAFLAEAGERSYAALQVYVKPSEKTCSALQYLRERIRDRYHIATTVGFGPRFLHSTGQLHKGGPGGGFFIQFTADDLVDVPIPDRVGSAVSSITFGVLKMAQVMGDRQALVEKGRPVMRFHFEKDVDEGLRSLAATL